MWKKAARFLVIGIIVVLLLGAVVLGITPAVMQHQARRSFPQEDGVIELPGLDGKVDIYRDEYGVPHIFAATPHDLFFAQGYVHAQDRFWQMDFWRHQGAGRLSELLGKATLQEDQFLRTLGWERIAEQEWQQIDADSKAILLAYAEGVNAYLADHQGAELSLEYLILPLINRGYQPEEWTPIHTLTWAKAMAWDLRGNMDSEIDRALLLQSLTPDEVAFLYPAYPESHPYIVGEHPVPEEARNIPVAKNDHSYLVHGEIAARLMAVREGLAALNTMGYPAPEGIGSNSWVLAGGKTATGKPLLANDPHLGAQLPSIWYQVGLHCLPEAEDCQLDLSGFSFAGAPGVVIGHNQHIAWGLTNVGPDVMDLYIEKINPENPNQYQYMGEWVDMELVTENIKIAGQEPSELSVRMTHHGPIISDVYGLSDFQEKAGIDLPDSFEIALRWTALEPSCVFCAIWKINKARNWEEFQEAAREFAVPSQNLIYADVDGNIGYQMPGKIPIRNSRHSGQLPVPGWTGEYEWQGYIPFEELPFLYNPDAGYIVTANNAVVDESYPYLISSQWSYGYRAQRLVDMIEEHEGLFEREDMLRMQGDNQDLLAEELVPVMLEVIENDENFDQAYQLLSTWDHQMNVDSAAGVLYMFSWRNMLEEVFSDQLPEFYDPGLDSCARQITLQLLDEPGSIWWDDLETDEIEGRDEIIKRSVESALSELRRIEGSRIEDWNWGDVHGITFQHQVMGNFPYIRKFFNRGPFPVAGGPGIVNANGWKSDQPYGVDWLPSLRMVVDLDDLTRSVAVHTTGQSGHAYHPHFIDMVDVWQTVDNTLMLWNPADIQAQAESWLQLVPEE